MKRSKCKGCKKCVVRKDRKIDRMIEDAAERLGGLFRVFEQAYKNALQDLLDVRKAVRDAYRRYRETKSLSQCVRQFVYKFFNQESYA